MIKWRCIVCRYMHVGDAPPETCPVCNADRAKFMQADDEEALHSVSSEPAAAPPESSDTAASTSSARREKAASAFSALSEQMVKFRSHPIMSHIPNGVLPAAVLFLFLGSVLSHEGLKTAAFYNLLLVVFAMPVVVFSGYLDWQAYYGGVYTSLIVTKIVCAAVIFLVGIVLVLWGSVGAGLFFLLHLVMLAAAVVAGYMGGKLVFGPKQDAQ